MQQKITWKGAWKFWPYRAIRQSLCSHPDHLIEDMETHWECCVCGATQPKQAEG